eukprot:NODE_832_length_3846_cov_0.252736.p1 type:complete len:405 gc:universal NODE_832_length_3846_cov_0.252736:1089-2303(+)
MSKFQNSIWFKRLMKEQVEELPIVKDHSEIKNVSYEQLDKQEAEFLKWTKDMVTKFKLNDFTGLNQFLECGKMLSKQLYMLDTDLSMSSKIIKELQKPLVIKRSSPSISTPDNDLLAYRLKFGKFGGWVEHQHVLYVKLRTALGHLPENEWINKCSKLLGIRVCEIEQHIEWEIQLEKLEIIQREAIRRWKTQKLKNNTIQEVALASIPKVEVTIKSKEEREQDKINVQLFKLNRQQKIQELQIQRQVEKFNEKRLLDMNIMKYKSKKSKNRIISDSIEAAKLPKLHLSFDSNSTLNSRDSTTRTGKKAYNEKKVIYDNKKSLKKVENDISKYVESRNRNKLLKQQHEDFRIMKVKELSNKITKSFKYDPSVLYKLNKPSITVVAKGSMNIETVDHKKKVQWRK